MQGSIEVDRLVGKLMFVLNDILLKSRITKVYRENGSKNSPQKHVRRLILNLRKLWKKDPKSQLYKTVCKKVKLAVKTFNMSRESRLINNH